MHSMITIHVMPRTRQPLPFGSRSSSTSPAIHTGAASGWRINTCCAMNASGPVRHFARSAARCEAIRSSGSRDEFATIVRQKISSASKPPSQIQGDANCRRCLMSSRPANDRSGKQHGILVQQAHTADGTEQEPQLRARAIENFQCDQRRAHPEERLENVHGQKQIEAKINRSDHHAHARQDHPEPPRAQFPRDRSREEHAQPCSHCRQKTQRMQRIAQGNAFKPRDHRDQRRLVDVTPRQMVTAREVIQLVSEVAVAPAHQHVCRKHDKRQPAQKRPFFRACTRRLPNRIVFRRTDPSIETPHGRERARAADVP